MTNQQKRPPSKYASASSANGQQQANYFLPCHGLVLINRIKECQDSSGIDQNVVETTVLHVFDDSVPGRDYTAKQPQRLPKAGEGVDEVIKKGNKARDQRLKGLALACSGLTNDQFLAEEEYPGQGFEFMCSEQQPYAGQVLEFVATQVVKKESKSKPDDQLSTSKDTYTRVAWKRKVPYAEVAKTVAPDVLTRFLPDIEARVAAEKS